MQRTLIPIPIRIPSPISIFMCNICNRQLVEGWQPPKIISKEVIEIQEKSIQTMEEIHRIESNRIDRY